MTDEPQQAMMAERLAEIRTALEDRSRYSESFGIIDTADMGMELLAEVERLRVVLAEVGSHVQEALTDIAQSVLESGGLPPEQFPLDHARLTVVSLEQRLTQMRWLLEQKGGGDGQR